MPKPTLVFAALPIARSAFLSSGSRTALLPAYAGLVLAILAGLALAFEGGRRHLMTWLPPSRCSARWPRPRRSAYGRRRVPARADGQRRDARALQRAARTDGAVVRRRAPGGLTPRYAHGNEHRLQSQPRTRAVRHDTR